MQGGAAASKFESAHRSNIGKLNKERTAEMDRMSSEVAALKNANQQLQTQYAGASSRRKVLEQEVRSAASRCMLGQ